MLHSVVVVAGLVRCSSDQTPLPSSLLPHSLSMKSSSKLMASSKLRGWLLESSHARRPNNDCLHCNQQLLCSHDVYIHLTWLFSWSPSALNSPGNLSCLSERCPWLALQTSYSVTWQEAGQAIDVVCPWVPRVLVQLETSDGGTPG